MSENFNLKSNPFQYMQYDPFGNLINSSPQFDQQNGLSFSYGQGNSFGQKGLAGSSFGQEARQSGTYYQQNDIFKSSMGQEYEELQQNYIPQLDVPNYENNLMKQSNELFELKFEEMQLQEKIMAQNSMSQEKEFHSNSLVESQESYQRIGKSNVDSKVSQEDITKEKKIKNAEEISLKFKPEIRQNVFVENFDLFNVNLAKSLYTNKITQLVESTNISNLSQSVSPKFSGSVSPKSKSQQKYQRKTSEKQLNSDFSSQEKYDQINQVSMSEAQQLRLAKNRESARNSRKRKKIYYDLLENKINEITQECDNLKDIIKAQNKEIQKQTNENQILQEFIDQQQSLFEKLGKLINDEKLPDAMTTEINILLDALRFRTSSNTQERINGGKYRLEQLIEISLPLSTRYLFAAAENFRDIFSQDLSNLHAWSDKLKYFGIRPQQILMINKMQPKIRLVKNIIQKQVDNLIDILDQINQEAQKVDFVLDQIRTSLGPKQMGQFLMFIYDNRFREELKAIKLFQNLKSDLQRDLESQFAMKIEEEEEPEILKLSQQYPQRKQIKSGKI